MHNTSLAKKTQEEEYLHLLQTVLTHAPGGIFSYSAEADEQFSFISENMLKFLGYTREEFQQKFNNRFSQMVYAEDRSRVLREISEQVAAGDFDRCEYRIEKKDGSLVWVHDEGHIAADENGRRWFYVVILDNSGDVRTQQNEQAQFQKSMQGLLDANPNALCCFRLNLTANRCISSFGTSPYIVGLLQHATADGLLAKLAAMTSRQEKKAETAAVFNRQHMLADFAKGIASCQVVYPRKNENGDEIWVRTNIRLLKNPDSGEVEAVGYSNDISRERLTDSVIRIITESEYDFIAVLHAGTGKVEAVNLNSRLPDSYYHGFDNEKSEQDFVSLRKNGAASWVAEEDREKYLRGTDLDVIRAQLDQNGHYALTIHTNLPDGKGNCRYRSLQHYYLGGSRNDILIIDSDVTEEKLQQQREAALMKAEARRVEDIIDSVATGICVFRMPDADHLEGEFVNLQMFRIIGLNPSDGPDARQIMMQDPMVAAYMKNAFIAVHPDDREKVRQIFHDGFEASHFSGGNYRILRRDGSAVWINQNAILREIRPTCRVFYATYRVVDREVELQNELEHQLQTEKLLRDQADAANAAKSDFLSRMSHDIRTPLNGIIGMTYLTREMELPAQARQNLDKIDTSSKFLLNLINDVLDMTKAESGKIELHPEPYDASVFFEYLNSVIAPLCQEKNITFTIEAEPAAGVLPLMDTLRVNQIFFNLLSNAVKFTPEGGRVTFRLKEHLNAEGRLAIMSEVSDTGIGMSEEFQKHLFEPFSQETRNDISEMRGTGLGLAIVKRLLDLMNCQIRVSSVLNQGTTFTLWGEFSCIPAAEAAAGSQLTAAGQPFLLAGCHVLLCEDHPLNQEIAKVLLNERNVIVSIAEDGQQGVDQFAMSAVGFYSAILMDIRMPVMDGYAATRAIRQLNRPDAGTVPIIAMTADAFSDDVQRCLQAGMNDHIAKPIDPERLYQVLNQWIASSAEKAADR